MCVLLHAPVDSFHAGPKLRPSCGEKARHGLRLGDPSTPWNFGNMTRRRLCMNVVTVLSFPCGCWDADEPRHNMIRPESRATNHSAFWVNHVHGALAPATHTPMPWSIMTLYSSPAREDERRSTINIPPGMDPGSIPVHLALGTERAASFRRLHRVVVAM